MRVIRHGSQCNNSCIFCTRAGVEYETLPSDNPLTENAAYRATQKPFSDSGVDVSIGDVGGAFAVVAGFAVDAMVSGNGVVVVVGREPTLCVGLPDVVANAVRSGANCVVLRSNARRLAYSAYVAHLVSAGLTGVCVGLHGSTAPMHDCHTNVDGSFSQTVRGVRNAVKQGLRVAICCIVTRSNYRHVGEIVRLAGALGVSTVFFKQPSESLRFSDCRHRVFAHAELVVPYLDGALECAHRVGVALRVDSRLTSVSNPAISSASAPAQRQRSGCD